MVNYALTYFNTTGRGEIIRLVLLAAGQLFTDNRIPADASWPALKPNTTWGSLPYLEVDGKVLGQTHAIVRYIAGQHGLAGTDAWERGLVDSVVEAARDVTELLWQSTRARAAITNATPEQTAFLKENSKQMLTSKALPTFLRHTEKFIVNHGQNGHAVGNKLTTADLAIFNAVRQLESTKSLGLTNITAPYPRIAAVVAKVLSNTKIREHVEASP